MTRHQSKYDTDILRWSEEQAELLRGVQAARINTRIDWDNIIEEVEEVGLSELRAVRSLILQAFVHDLKAQAWPASRDVPKWQSDARLYRRQAKYSYAPSMAQRIELTRIYADALEDMPTEIEGQKPQPVSQQCPATSVAEYLGIGRDS